MISLPGFAPKNKGVAAALFSFGHTPNPASTVTLGRQLTAVPFELQLELISHHH
jgi:hypothetical protein